MHITFTRGEESTYSMSVLREGGVCVQFAGGDRKFPLPHDFAHYIVEHELGLKQGFWGRVAAGAVYSGMTIVSGRQAPHSAEKSKAVIREAEQQGVEAEVMVSFLLKVMQENLDNNLPVLNSLLKEQWQSNRPERNLPYVSEVQRISKALREATQQWQSLEIGQGITVFWPCQKLKKR